MLEGIGSKAEEVAEALLADDAARLGKGQESGKLQIQRAAFYRISTALCGSDVSQASVWEAFEAVRNAAAAARGVTPRDETGVVHQSLCRWASGRCWTFTIVGAGASLDVASISSHIRAACVKAFALAHAKEVQERTEQGAADIAAIKETRASMAMERVATELAEHAAAEAGEIVYRWPFAFHASHASLVNTHAHSVDSVPMVPCRCQPQRHLPVVIRCGYRLFRPSRRRRSRRARGGAVATACGCLGGSACSWPTQTLSQAPWGTP